MLKTMHFFLIIFAVCLFGCSAAQAQEMNFTVKVIPPPANRSVDLKVYQALQQSLQELVNNTKWTDDVFEQNERIMGTIQLNVKAENSTTSFTADMTVQANRAVYGADQLSPLFVYLDQGLTFSYEQFQPMQYARNTFSDNLVSTMAYYVQVVLATDYDSFSPSGGEPFWLHAQDIVNSLPADVKTEWTGRNNNSRGWFVENVFSPRLKSFRQATYEYHRQGIDFAVSDMSRCRIALMKALEHIEEAHQSYPNTLSVRIFAVTKGDELIEIFKNGTPEQKAKFTQIMTKIDPSNVQKYTQVGF